MKFARVFQDRLTKEGFPDVWVDSAVSYSQLKKCIKRVQNELTAIGLDVTTLHTLLESVEQQRLAARNDCGDEEVEKPFQYIFGRDAGSGSIHPKLLFVVDEATGEPLDARLAPETKNYLHQLALSENLTDIRITDEDGDSLNRSVSVGSAESAYSTGNGRRSSSRAHRLVEIPLTTDTEFFSSLQSELSGIAEIQSEEQTKLTKSIRQLGTVLTKATDPSNSKAKQDLAHWRRIFELYLESRIFFATNEQDHGTHTGAQAQEAFGLFLQKVQKANLLNKFKVKESSAALHQFLEINTQLLQCLKFQEINQIAMTKILKSN
jgi:E3 ubiquitin-protein ligase BAH